MPGKPKLPMRAAKAENRTVQFDEFGNAIELSGGAEDSGTPPISARLTPTATRSAANRLPSKKEITKKKMPDEDGNFCEPSMFVSA